MTPQTDVRIPFCPRNTSRTLALTVVGLAAMLLGAAGASGQVAAAKVIAPESAATTFAINHADGPAVLASSSSVAADVPVEAASALPDAPSALQEKTLNASTASPNAPKAGPVATVYTKYIPAGWTAQPITARDKVILGARDLYSPLNFLAMIASAGYEQALNGEPNYGTDRGAFGERLGAAAIRESTQGFFTDAVFAPMLHEDPRYYVEGEQYGFVHRTLYAVTRPIVTRTDSGRTTVNGALLLGYAGSAALSYSYYPQINKNFPDTASTFGGSLGGAAVGFFVSEFSNQFLQAIHLAKKQ